MHGHWRERVSSRWLLGRPYRPIRHPRRLHCPWLVCVGEADRVARSGPPTRWCSGCLLELTFLFNARGLPQSLDPSSTV
jgi:hypothetical protein